MIQQACGIVDARRRTREHELSLGPAGLGRVEPGIEGKVREVALLSQAAEDGADLADDQLEHEDLLLEQRQQLILERSTRHQIEYENFSMLADAIDPADPLLDRH